MSAKHLLPCHDGKTVAVTTADAGRMVVCPCGKKVQVPTLRGVQSLPLADDPTARPVGPSWTAQQGAMFTGGLSLLLVGLIALGMLYSTWRRIDTTKPTVNPEYLAELQSKVESAEPANTLEGWYLLRYIPLPDDRGVQPWEVNRQAAQKFVIFMSIAGTVAGVGLLLTIAGPLWRAAPQRAPKRRITPQAAK